jgi:fatty acid desaturase
MFIRFATRAPVQRAAPRAIEWPTLVVAIAIYGGWLAATWLHGELVWPLRIAIGGWLIAWHGSLQHEIIHGHPTPWRRVNTLLGSIPLSLWLPFERYRQTHLAHHATDRVTEPGVDPESRYLPAPTGQSPALEHRAGALQASLAGRMLLGPVFEIWGFLRSEAHAARAGDTRQIGAWVRHLIGVAIVVAWLKLACGMTLVDYLLTFIYPGAALTLIRSFAEHRAHDLPGHRVAIVERAPLLGLLFLNNNLHAVHHARPSEPWYGLPGLYRHNRDEVLQANGGLVYAGYGDVFARFLFRPHDDLVHPSASGGPVRP